MTIKIISWLSYLPTSIKDIVLLDDILSINYDYRYLLPCNQWLALDRADSKTSRFLRVSSFQELNQGAMLRSNINNKIFDDHIWLSVGVRKSKSHFTRLQRLSVCLSLLFMTMISNAMWYKTESTEKSPQSLSIGPFSFTVHQLYTSIMSSLIVVPPMLMITIFFRKSKIRVRKDSGSKLKPKSNSSQRKNIQDSNDYEEQLRKELQLIDSAKATPGSESIKVTCDTSNGRNTIISYFREDIESEQSNRSCTPVEHIRVKQKHVAYDDEATDDKIRNENVYPSNRNNSIFIGRCCRLY